MNTDAYIHVSYILATLNKALYLDRVLNNIREFISPDDELIVIDGGSTDETPDVICRHNDIITIFNSEKDTGPAHAYNKALLKSRGRIIVNINDDDYFYPGGVLKAVQVMDENPEIDALICGGERAEYDAESGTIKFAGYQYLPESKILATDIKNVMRHTTAGFLILRRSIIASVGIFDTSVQAADTEFMSRLMLCGTNFKYLNLKMFRHTEYPHSSQRNVHQSNIDRIRILVRHGEWPELLQFEWLEVEIALGLNKSGKRSYYKEATRLLIKASFNLAKNILALTKREAIVGHKRDDENRVAVEPIWDLTLR
jgi:glycosyltransferase involved in cell wall biosynthesis